MEYPSWRYNATLPARIIYSPEEEDAGWETTPAAFAEEPSPAPLEEKRKGRRK